MTIQTRPTLPRKWIDPHLRAAAAKQLLMQPGHLLLVHQAGGHLLGYAAAGAVADILTLYVPENARRSGHAQALLQAFMQQAEAAGASALTLEVRAANTAAQALYQNAGLAEINRRSGYYENPADDAVVLSRSLV
jgi:[ribosomal protein S18]-alanine N-acetyltransferase